MLRGEVHFTLRPSGAIFHNFLKKIISHSATPNSSFEISSLLCYTKPNNTNGGGDMKKKILIGILLLLVLITAIIFLAGAIESYNDDLDPANGVDILEGLGAAILIVVGGLVILCEIDLFFTVYYFFIKPKTLFRSLFMVLSQLMILLVIFSKDLSHFLFLYVSEIFREEIIVIAPIVFLYVTLRLVCVSVCFSKKD